MKLSKMYEEMQKRYTAEAEKKRKAEEEAARKLANDKDMLKEVICELVQVVRQELENGLGDVICNKFVMLRHQCPRAKRIKTCLICEVLERGFYLTINVNGRESSYADVDGPHVIPGKDDNHEEHEYYALIKKIINLMNDRYEAEEDSVVFIFKYSLDDNTVTITWDFDGSVWRFKDDLKEVFPGSVHRFNGTDMLILNLD